MQLARSPLSLLQRNTSGAGHLRLFKMLNLKKIIFACSIEGNWLEVDHFNGLAQK